MNIVVDKFILLCYNSNVRGVAQLEERCVRDAEAAGSNPVTSTITFSYILNNGFYICIYCIYLLVTLLLHMYLAFYRRDQYEKKK